MVPDPVPPLAEFAEDEVVADVCAVADGEPGLLEFADDEVDVDVCADALPAPELPAAVLAPVDVEVEAWAPGDDGAGDVEVEAWAPGDEGAGDVEVEGLVGVLPAVVAEVVPVLVCAFEPLEPACVPVEVVVPVWALELPPAA